MPLRAISNDSFKECSSRVREYDAQGGQFALINGSLYVCNGLMVNCIGDNETLHLFPHWKDTFEVLYKY